MVGGAVVVVGSVLWWGVGALWWGWFHGGGRVTLGSVRFLYR